MRAKDVAVNVRITQDCKYELARECSTYPPSLAVIIESLTRILVG